MSAKELGETFGFLQPVEIELLDQLIKGLPKDPLVINLGAGVGTSAMAILEARDDVYVVTVDKECGELPLGGLLNEENIIRGAKWLHRRSSICSESTAAGKNWYRFKEEPWWRRKVDMVVHDAAHDYGLVLTEIEAWLPRVRAKGVIAVHDYDSPNWGGVVNAVDETLRAKFKYIDQQGMMIAFRKEKSDEMETS
jgi:hypothetical protein